MFKRIEIHLSGPLCKCEVNHLAWNVFMNSEGREYLVITCSECKVTMTIPAKKFVAAFKLDIPYPGEKPKEKLTVMDGGKVIPFHKDDHGEGENG